MGGPPDDISEHVNLRLRHSMLDERDYTGLGAAGSGTASSSRCCHRPNDEASWPCQLLPWLQRSHSDGHHSRSGTSLRDADNKNEVVHAKDAELGRGCVGSSGMGKVVYYTRAHVGTDSFSYDSASSSGVVHVYVTVRSARTSGPAAAEPSTAQPRLPTPAQLIAGEPMHIALVRAQGPGCDPNCPTWITASGKIVPGTAEKLRQVIRSLAGRRLPILVNSPGGSVAEAMAMGRLIRRSGFSVAVADTSLAVCQPVGKSCEDQRASTSFGAICEVRLLACGGGRGPALRQRLQRRRRP